jgi:hypothetical protein
VLCEDVQWGNLMGTVPVKKQCFHYHLKYKKIKWFNKTAISQPKINKKKTLKLIKNA